MRRLRAQMRVMRMLVGYVFNMASFLHHRSPYEEGLCTHVLDRGSKRESGTEIRELRLCVVCLRVYIFRSMRNTPTRTNA